MTAPSYFRPAIVYAVVLFVVVAAVATGERLTRADPPSFVLITVDSLRADHLGIYGYERSTSPNIDALARRGVVLDRAYTVETLSGPSHASIFTSLYPVTHGVVYNGYRLDDAAVTLAELLRKTGHRTAAFVSDWLLDDSQGFGQGFEKFELSQVASNHRGPKLRSREGRSYQLARYWLMGKRGQRFFLWLHCQQPHFSYDPPAPWDQMFSPEIPRDYPYRHYKTMLRALEEGRLTEEDRERVIALYDGEIAFTDELLQPLFAELQEHHDNVFLVLTADHGDFLFEGAPERTGHGRGDFYDGAMRVPLIVVPPAGFRRAAAHLDALVSTVDILPTLAELAGIEPPAGLEGRSFAGLLDGSAAGSRERVHAMYVKYDRRPTVALRTATHKLIHRGGPEPQTELYDVARDPWELRDLAADETALTARLRDELLGWFHDRPDRFAGAPRELSPEVRALLEQGGYLDEEDDD